jgi:hypothetical protein
MFDHWMTTFDHWMFQRRYECELTLGPCLTTEVLEFETTVKLQCVLLTLTIWRTDPWSYKSDCNFYIVRTLVRKRCCLVSNRILFWIPQRLKYFIRNWTVTVKNSASFDNRVILEDSNSWKWTAKNSAHFATFRIIFGEKNSSKWTARTLPLFTTSVLQETRKSTAKNSAPFDNPCGNIWRQEFMNL